MWCFCESVDQSKINPGDKVVALGPLAEYLLSKHDTEHVYLSTPFDEDRLYNERDGYFLEQLGWIDSFEAWLTNRLSDFNITNPGLVHAHYYQLVFLVDSLHIHSYVLNNFFNTQRPDKIRYFRNWPRRIDYSPYELHKHGNVLIQDIAKEVFRKNGVDFNFIETKIKNADSFGLFLDKLFNVAEKSSKLLGAKPLYECGKYGKFSRLYFHGSRLKKNFLVLNAGVRSMDLVIRELVKRAEGVYFKEQGSIYKMNSLISRKCFCFDENSLEKEYVFGAFKEIAKGLQSSNEVFSWLDKVSCSTARSVLLPYFEYFLNTICAKNLIEVKQLSGFFEEKKIDFVVSRSSSEDFAISSLIAAKEKKIQRAVFQHGMSPLDWRAWHITELKLNDLYFTTDTISEHYFKDALKNEYAGQCKVFQSPHYLKFLNSLRSKNRFKDDLVVYVPMRGFWGFRCLNNMRYPLTWYFRLQKALVDLLGNHKELRVVFKLGSGQEWAEESVVSYIKDQGYGNIIVKRDDFIHYTKSGARILTDYPSSALYEAASVGLPVMSLCYRKLPFWPEARQFFGASIQIFSSFDEALGLTEAFLNSPKEKYLVENLPFSDSSDFIEMLRGSEQ